MNSISSYDLPQDDKVLEVNSAREQRRREELIDNYQSFAKSHCIELLRGKKIFNEGAQRNDEGSDSKKEVKHYLVIGNQEPRTNIAYREEPQIN